jgi:hypothetical protein
VENFFTLSTDTWDFCPCQGLASLYWSEVATVAREQVSTSRQHNCKPKKNLCEKKSKTCWWIGVTGASLEVRCFRKIGNLEFGEVGEMAELAQDSKPSSGFPPQVDSQLPQDVLELILQHAKFRLFLIRPFKSLVFSADDNFLLSSFPQNYPTTIHHYINISKDDFNQNTGNLERSRIHETYFDTPEGHLNKLNLWLRDRPFNGNWTMRWVQESYNLRLFADINNVGVICKILKVITGKCCDDPDNHDPLDFCDVGIASFVVNRFTTHDQYHHIDMVELKHDEFYLTESTSHGLENEQVFHAALTTPTYQSLARSNRLAFLAIYNSTLAQKYDTSQDPVPLVKRDELLPDLTDNPVTLRPTRQQSVDADAFDRIFSQTFPKFSDPFEFNEGTLDLRHRLFSSSHKQAFIVEAVDDQLSSERIQNIVDQHRIELKRVDMSDNQLRDCDLPHVLKFILSIVEHSKLLQLDLQHNWFTLDDTVAVDTMNTILRHCESVTVSFDFLQMLNAVSCPSIDKVKLCNSPR